MNCRVESQVHVYNAGVWLGSASAVFDGTWEADVSESSPSRTGTQGKATTGCRQSHPCFMARLPLSINDPVHGPATAAKDSSAITAQDDTPPRPGLSTLSFTIHCHQSAPIAALSLHFHAKPRVVSFDVFSPGGVLVNHMNLRDTDQSRYHRVARQPMRNHGKMILISPPSFW